MFNTFILIIICVAIYFIYAFSTDKEAERNSKQDPLNRQSLEKYNTKRNLFLLFKDYLYSNIIFFQTANNKLVIENIIKTDFPQYGKGIYGLGIMRDLETYDLLDLNSNGEVYLDGTFEIISIAYKNFNTFLKEVYHSEYKMGYSEGGYYSEFGDDIRTKVMHIKVNNGRIYFGLSSDGTHLNLMKKRHNLTTEKHEMYLFSELEINENSKVIYPTFNMIKLRKDLSINEYHEYFNKIILEFNRFI